MRPLFRLKSYSSKLRLRHTNHTFPAHSPNYSNMALLKRIFSKRKTEQPIPDLRDDAIPRLVRKKKSKKAALPKPQPAVLGLILEDFSNPTLPTIVLRPATPPAHIFDVQDRLFERSGAVFILRKEEISVEGQWPGSTTSQYLRVPAKRNVVQACGSLSPIDESDAESEESNDSGVGLDEEPDDSGVGLDEELDDSSICLDGEYEADYRAYMAGMNGEI